MSLENTIGNLSVLNMPPFLKALQDTPKVQLRYMRTELSRGLKRIRKRFVSTQLQGGEGINAPKMSKGKNVFTFVKANSLSDLGGKIGISRVLHVHEIGMTIVPKSADMLSLHAPGRGAVFATAKKVVIPARLKFRQQVQAEAPAELRKVAAAGYRAAEQTMTKGLLKGVRI